MFPAVIEQEKICGNYFITKFHGHRLLADSFYDFFAITLNSAADAHYRYGWPEHPYYVPCLLEFVTQFRGMRAAEILSLNGYPLDGYALQRNLKDQALFIGAIVDGASSFPALYGISTPPASQPWSEADHQKVRSHRLEEETRIVNLMIGRNSGLGTEHVDALKRWSRLFNMQVHGSRLSASLEMQAWVRDKKDFAVGPRLDDYGSTMYMNRFTEVAWMTLRTLPFLQTEQLQFNEQWQHEWGVLDDSFRISFEGLGDLGKKIAPAFIAMIDTKFAATPALRYIERE